MRKKLSNAILAAGSSQVFWYASLPIITRIYPKEAIGLFGQFVTYAGFISVVISARADLAILTSRREDALIVRMAFLKLSRILLGGVIVFLGLFSLYVENPLLTPLGLIFLAAGGLLASRFLIDGTSLMRLDDYESLRRTAFGRSLAQALSQFALSMAGAYGLVMGKVVGDFCGVYLRRKRIIETSSSSIKELVRFSDEEKNALRSNARAYRYSFPQTLINAASQGLPFFILPAYLSLEWISEYSLAFMIVVAPVGLIVAPVRQVLVASFSTDLLDEATSRKALKGRVIRASGWLALLALAGLIFLYFFSAPLMILAFGPGWTEAARLVVWLWLWVGSGLILTPAISYLLADGNNKRHLEIEVLQMAGRILAIFLGVNFLAEEQAIFPFILWSALANLASFIWIIGRKDAPAIDL